MHPLARAGERPLLTRRISRRRAIAAGSALAGAAGALALAGCDGGSGGGANGGSLRFGSALAPTAGLDPQIEQAGGLAIFPKLYGYLLHVDSRDDSVILDHAQSVEYPDDRTYIFRLRGDVRFHDVAPANGRNVHAEDVVRSVQRYRDNPIAVNKLWHATVLDAVDASDDRTVRMTTRIPYVYSLGHMNSINAGAIVPAEVADENVDVTGSSPGSGPLLLDSLALPERARLRKFDGHYNANSVHVDAMEWSFFADDSAKRQAFDELLVDIVPARDSTEAQELAGLDDVASASEPSLAYLSLALRTDRAPFNDERVRRAVDLAIDRDALLAVASPGAGAAVGPVNEHLADAFWSLSAEEITAASGGGDIEERRAEARSLIEAATSGLAFRLQVAELPELADVALFLRDQLTSVGAFVVLEPVPQLAAFLNFRQGNFDAILVSQQPYESPDVPTRMYHSAGPEGTGNPSGFSNAEIDLLIERSWGESDRDARRDTLLEAQRLMVERRPLVQLISAYGFTAWHEYVRDMPQELPGSLAQFYAQQSLDLPVDGRPA